MASRSVAVDVRAEISDSVADGPADPLLRASDRLEELFEQGFLAFEHALAQAEGIYAHGRRGDIDAIPQDRLVVVDPLVWLHQQLAVNELP